MLTTSIMNSLRTPAGAELIEAADAMREEPLRCIEMLRRRAPPELAAAAYDQALLRRRAVGKFSRAGRMFFTRDLLEQASGEVVAAHRARRFAGAGAVADLCCGLGGDAAALAGVARVVAVDQNPLAVALTATSVEAYGDHVCAVVAQVPEFVPRVRAAFIDPGRRRASGATGGGPGGRTHRLEQMSPPISAVLELHRRVPALGIKLSPAVSHRALDAAFSALRHEREAISVRGECREMVVWTGELATTPRRATLLPEGRSLVGTGEEELDIRPPGWYLYEPDTAVIRARLVARAAASIGAWGIDPSLAYLSTDRYVSTPWATAYCIEVPRPFSRKSLTRLLRERGAGDLILKTRGFAERPEALRQQLSAGLRGGSACPVVFIARVQGRAVMIVGERVGAGTESHGR